MQSKIKIGFSNTHKGKEILSGNDATQSSIVFVDNRHVSHVHQSEDIQALLNRVVFKHRERPWHHVRSQVYDLLAMRICDVQELFGGRVWYRGMEINVEVRPFELDLAVILDLVAKSSLVNFRRV